MIFNLKNIFLATLMVTTFTSETTMAIELKDKYAVATEKAFNQLSAANINILDDYYSDDAYFKDPITDVKGLKAIKDYYAHVYANVKTIRFDFSAIIREDDTQAAVWTMYLTHPSLNGGKEMTLAGNSLIKFNLETGKVIYHRDYYDMGEFVYENIPGLGGVLKFIKKRMKP